MKELFLSIIGKGVKDNTYKFAFAKFLLDYSYGEALGGDKVIYYSEIAEKFLEYYWYQECKYKLKQDFKIERMPVVIRIIRAACGTDYIPDSYDKYFKNRKDLKTSMILDIEKKCLNDVVPRFQPRDNYLFYQHFHTLNASGKKFRQPPEDKRYIVLQEKTHQFLKENYHELIKILIFEWAKFLEKTNFTPRLISKIENLGHHKRRSLNKFRKILLEQMGPICFYCDTAVSLGDIHVDHFIPWSYVYDDALWNLVISCNDCNLKKSDRLAPEACISKIDSRNIKFGFNEYKKDVGEYYDNCKKAGFFQDGSLECI